MFFVLSKIFEFVLTPVNFAILAGALGVLLAFTRYAKTGRALLSGAVLLLLILGFSPLPELLAMPLEARFPLPPDDAPAPAGIIVLGGSVDEKMSGLHNSVAINDSAERITAPIALKRRYPSARLVFTGGSGALLGGIHTEAEAVGVFWRETGLDQGDVFYESQSRNTYENAVATRDLVKPKPGDRWLLVTSAMHMPRAVGIFRKAGFPVVAYPVDYRAVDSLSHWSPPRHASGNFQLAEAALHEWLGLAAYRLTGKTDALFPAP
ncbi:MAG: YdcF family protein [Hyphomicrobiales bacterium]|jgi:uncharacterized SAM-binding protein YcdF (DUF218 family)|nr:MAG: YdcF family protein [Hyphomicrobiales bacterium]